MPDLGLSSELLTPAAVAQRLGITPQTVRNYVRNGRLRGCRVGGQWRINAEAIDNFVTPGCDQSTMLDLLADEIAAAAPELSVSQRERIAAVLRAALPIGQRRMPFGAQ